MPMYAYVDFFLKHNILLAALVSMKIKESGWTSSESLLDPGTPVMLRVKVMQALMLWIF